MSDNIGLQIVSTAVYHLYCLINLAFHHIYIFGLYIRAIIHEAQQLPKPNGCLSLYLPILLVEELVNLFVLWDVDFFSLRFKDLGMLRWSMCLRPWPAKLKFIQLLIFKRHNVNRVYGIVVAKFPFLKIFCPLCAKHTNCWKNSACKVSTFIR